MVWIGLEVAWFGMYLQEPWVQIPKPIPTNGVT